MNKTLDKDEAIAVIANILKDINETHDNLESMPAEDVEQSPDLDQIGPLDIYNCLPQSNCGDCGEATCLAFAVKLLAGDHELENCLPLQEPWNQQYVECLNNLLGSPMMKTLGWDAY